MYIPECTIAYQRKDGTQYSGSLKASGLKAQVSDRNGEICVVINPSEHLRLISFTMTFHWICETDERFFMNGFRSDSPCMETGRDNRYSVFSTYLRNYMRVSTAAKLFSSYDIHNGSPMGFSYCYFRTSRNNFRLLASLNERNGYTIFQYDGIDSTIYISKDVEGISLGLGEYKLMSIKIYDGPEDYVFGQWFDDLNLPRLEMQPTGGFSTNAMGYQVDALGIEESLDNIETISAENKLFLVAEGWSVAKGDWTPAPYKFPEGMAQVARRIHDRGLKAALWISPFSIDRRSQLASKHRDWIKRDRNNKIVNSPMDVNLVALDVSRADVMDYIRRLIDTVVNQWGFDMVVAGDLYMAGLVAVEGQSRAASMYQAMEVLREITGSTPVMAEDVPLMPAFGQVDYCHISTGASVSTKAAIRSVRSLVDYFTPDRSVMGALFRRQLNGRAWVNTPKEYSLSKQFVKALDTSKKAGALVSGMLGMPQLITDNPTVYDEEQQKLIFENMQGTQRKICRTYEEKNKVVVEYLDNGEICRVKL